MGNSHSSDGNGSTPHDHHHPHHQQHRTPAVRRPLDHREREREGEGSAARSTPTKQNSPSPAAIRRTRTRTPSTTPPIAPNLVSGVSGASTSTSRAQARGDVVSASPKHTRARSVTHTQPKFTAHDISFSHKSDSHAHAMGNNESSEAKPPPMRPPSRSQTLPVRPATPHALDAPPSPASHASHAVDVPQPAPHNHDGVADTTDSNDYIPAGYSTTPYAVPSSDYNRPPRLPLPIEEEVHTPGSPIITPQDITSPLDAGDIDSGALPRKASVLSSTTVDDEDVGDNDAFAQESTQSLQVRVPTRLGWYGGGDKVFVTGTFCNWEKKIKLPRIKDAKDGKDGFAANIALPPGTHHIKFLVDGEMVTSSDLPTTVDWTNILVNYIEVVAPLPPVAEDAKQSPVPAEPMPIPGATISSGQATGADDGTATPLPNLQASETDDDVSSTLKETVDGKVERPPTPSTEAVSLPQQTPTPKQQIDKAEKAKKAAAQKKALPRPQYTNQIPEFLIDLDNFQNPEDEKFQRANRVAANLPQPPSLPMFLSKSILNSTTPHKDDASVLVMPNHTVLNHLATSSIKSGVLATSGTTRYKRKVWPVSEVVVSRLLMIDSS